MTVPTVTGLPVYPTAPRRELVEELHGLRIADPYRELEDAAAPATVAWCRAQEELFRAHRAGWPGLADLHRTLTGLLDTGSVSAPVTCGGLRFHTRGRPGADRPALVVTEDGAERTLLDPLALDPSGGTVLDAWAPSREGARIAVQTSTGGTEDSVLHVLDVATGAVLDGPVDRLRRSAIAWLPGGGAFYYVRRLPPELHPGEERYHRRVWLHRVGTDPAEDVPVFGEGRDPRQFYAVSVSEDGRWLIVTATAGASPGTEVRLADLAATGPERPDFSTLRLAADARTTATVRRGRLYLLTRDGAPRGRIETADPARPDDRTVLLPEDPEAVLEDLAVLDGPEPGRTLLAVTRTRHGVAEVTLHDAADGTRYDRAALPGAGAVGPLRTDPDGGTRVWFGYTDHVTPNQVLCHDAATGTTALWAAPEGAPDTGGAQVRLLVYPSHDGTPVRMFVVSPTGRPDRPRPTVLSGYGGFGASVLPGFAVQALAWVRAGGVYAFACLRGGGEEGEQWHRAGRRELKHNTFDDLDAAAAHLTAEGWTPPGGLALIGSSNGGLTVAAALTRRPDRYAAVVAVAPLLDMVRYELSGMGPSWSQEYGTAADPEQLAVLHGYSPYHRVRDGVRYPAVLFGVADGDTRVDPLHARKTAAALQAASSGPGPVLLRQEYGLGHGERGIGATVDLLADSLAFLAAHTGLPVDQQAY